MSNAHYVGVRNLIESDLTIFSNDIDQFISQALITYSMVSI